MRLTLRGRTPVVLACAAGLVIVACVISSRTGVIPLGKPNGPGPIREVRTPLKAHLMDGAVVIFPSGARVGNGTVAGSGTHYDATLSNTQPVLSVPLDSVLGMEVFDRSVNPVRTLIYSTATTAATAATMAVLALAIFGSCPTVYADSAGIPVLQAESFSYSIAPLLEKRDVDRLNVTPDSNGVVRLEVRNEALETHYTDHLELVEVRHRPDEFALPLAKAGAVAVRGLIAPTTARDGAGRDVRNALEAVDDRIFATDDSLLARAARAGPIEDHIDITVPRVPGRDSLAVVVRMRSSLLTTTLFYEHMLARPGASSLDWVARDLSRITTVAQLANWYAGNFGLHVSVLDHGRWRGIVRLMEFGPTAWRNVAAIVPAIGEDSVRIRFSFVPDEWRIDRIALAWDVRHLEQRLVPVSRVTEGDGRPRPDVAEILRRADDRRLRTEPGQRYRVEFDVGPSATGARTFFLGAQGYYVEWVRGGWLAAAKDSVPFSPGSEAVREILQSWRASKDSLEQRFFRARVPVV